MLLPAQMLLLAAAASPATPGLYLPEAVPDGPGAPGGAAAAAPAPPAVRLRWPFPLWQDGFTGNYVDLDVSPAIRDYDCSAVSYNGHRGHDIGVRDFFDMDQGRFVVASAAGTVEFVADGNFDRNTSCAPTPGNAVIVRHDDGSRALYWHFARHSTRVHVGQRVHEGEPLGWIGSSGCSTDPHLHLEIDDGLGTNFEPSSGACQASPTLWQRQPPHAFALPARVWSSGTMLSQPDIDVIRERHPSVTHVAKGAGSVRHWFWIVLAGVEAGDVSRVVYRRPDTSIHADLPYTHTASYSYSFWYWSADLGPADPEGSWSFEYTLNGQPLAQGGFTYDSLPLQRPVALGRTLVVDRAVVRDELHARDDDGGIRLFRLSRPPANGELALSGPRSSWFRYEPRPGFAGLDSFEFEALDADGRLSLPGTMTLDVRPAGSNVLHLEGEEDHVSIPPGGGLDLAGSLTIEAWIRRARGSAGWEGIVDRRAPIGLNRFGYHLFLDAEGRPAFGLGDGTSAFRLVATTPLPLERWVHVAGTWDGSAIRLFLDGVEEATALPFAGPISYAGVGETRIGGSFLAGESFRGDLDEVRIWRTARTAAELVQGASCAFRAGPLPGEVHARWSFDGDARDASSFAQHGSVVGGASFRPADPGPGLDCAGLDQDGDGIADPADSCPLDANPTQDDGDGDGIGDACDRCPGSAFPWNTDTDDDAVADACDSCPFRGNSDQSDADGDGSGDLCDPRPADPAEGVPGSGIRLTFAHQPIVSRLSWGPEPRSASYEVFRGSRQDLIDRWYGECRSSRDPDPGDLVFDEAEAPLPGEVFFYHVRGVSPGGRRGLLGLDERGGERDLEGRDCP